ncbi:RNA ligase 1 isoform X2 [Pyxicephalus adspersus]|uniref:RNA ligase 1 isoform X2 n=1 Tax=Pyxicephalus adspersus TaxID=30357 RepID=UPI003B5C7682
MAVMQQAGAVQQKIPCVFLTEVKDEPSSKRKHQMFKVVATETINPLALNADIHNALPTEKVDGTCCYVANHKGCPYLWARFDRKPTKQADKKFKKHVFSKGSSKAKGVKRVEGKPYPDENGHIPGWVPVENSNKQYCWHSCAVNYTLGVAIVLRPRLDDPDSLEICLVHLSDLFEQTLELIGTNINGNPYGIGNKKNPIHLLVPHGAFLIRNLPALNPNSLISWFNHCQEGKVEGIVWHCKDGSLIKLHRHHLGLSWPLKDTHLNSKPVSIRVNLCEYEEASNSLLPQFSKLDSLHYDSLKDVLLD